MEIGRIGQFARSECVFERKKGPGHETKDSDPNEHGGKVRVASAKDARGGHNQRFAAAKPRHDVVRMNAKGDCFIGEDGLIDPAVEFAKVRLRRDAHPHNKVFIGHTLNGTDNFGVGFVKVLCRIVVGIKESVALASGRVHVGQSIDAGILRSTAICRAILVGTFGILKGIGATGFTGLSKRVFHVAFPSDPVFNHYQRLTKRVVAGYQSEVIVEERIGNESTGIERNIAEFVERFAIRGTDRVLIAHPAQQLKGVLAAVVTPMILVKVCELVMNQNGRRHVYGSGKGNFARPILVVIFANSANGSVDIVRAGLVVGVVFDLPFDRVLLNRIDLQTWFAGRARERVVEVYQVINRLDCVRKSSQPS